jgi:hypothetical protein
MSYCPDEVVPPIPPEPPLTYLTPVYINLDMMVNQLAKSQIYITTNPALDAPGLYINLANDLLAKGEAYVIKTILNNYVNIPLQSIYYTGPANGSDFNVLANDPQYGSTYTEIRDLFLNSAFWQIYKSYYGNSGNANGNDIITQYANKVSAYLNTLQRLNQAGNPAVKNAFSGLKLANNGSKRVPGVARVPNIPQGVDQSWAAFNAINNQRWGFNR